MDSEVKQASAIIFALTLITSMIVATSYVVNTPRADEDTFTYDLIGNVDMFIYLPFFTIYDPYGDMSYQELNFGRNFAFNLELEGKDGNEAVGTIFVQLTGPNERMSIGSSVSHGPSDTGPGVGDRIIGYGYWTYWSVYRVYRYCPQENQTYEYYRTVLDSYDHLSSFALSRTDLSNIAGISVENRVGTPASWSSYHEYTPPGSVTGNRTMGWFGRIKTGYCLNFTAFGIRFNFTYSMLFSYTPPCYSICHFEDSSATLAFRECADDAVVTSNVVVIRSHDFWFSPP